MQSIGSVIGKNPKIKDNFKKLIKKVLDDQEIKDFISEHNMSEDEISRSYSRFFEYVKERDKFNSGEQTLMKGHKPVLVMSDNFATVSYQETEELIRTRKQQKDYTRLNRDSIINDNTVRKATFENFIAETEEEKAALSFMKRIAQYYKKGGTGNTVLSGPAGTGKSHLSMAVLKECLENENTTVLFISFSEMLDLMKDYFGNKSSQYSPEYFKRLMSEVDLLVIDDIGAEKITEYSQDVLTKVLDSRTETIITTNLDSKELRNKYHGRIYSRIFRGIDNKAFNFKDIKDKRVSQLPF
ncbi:ATP-binding protein [Lactococcus petauri]|uniref:ATP-binding protein n=1 Tax=Lactococcus petauri TaxID=1940789 RepID=UPI003851A35E